MIPLHITVGAAILALLAGFGTGSLFGYRQHGIQDKARERDELIEQTEKMAENLGILAIVNAQVVDSQVDLLEKQTATNKAIEGVKREIKTKPVGGCSLTPDADSLRQQAHQATAGSLSK